MHAQSYAQHQLSVVLWAHTYTYIFVVARLGVPVSNRHQVAWQISFSLYNGRQSTRAKEHRKGDEYKKKALLIFMFIIRRMQIEIKAKNLKALNCFIEDTILISRRIHLYETDVMKKDFRLKSAEGRPCNIVETIMYYSYLPRVVFKGLRWLREIMWKNDFNVFIDLSHHSKWHGQYPILFHEWRQFIVNQKTKNLFLSSLSEHNHITRRTKSVQHQAVVTHTLHHPHAHISIKKIQRTRQTLPIILM